MSEFLATLGESSWRIEAPASGAEIPAHVIARYGTLPAELVAFISSFSSCTSPSEKAWFVSVSDLAQDEPFRFNEYEIMSLAAAGSDAGWTATIREFWRMHFPLLLSLSGSYQYFAVSLAGATQGSVVYGSEPEFEECSVVAPSLAEFLAMFAAAVRSPTPAYPFSLAIPQNAA
jgi:hypothetical protein